MLALSLSLPGLATLSKNIGLPAPPSGYASLIDRQGTCLTNKRGNVLVIRT